MTQRKCRVLIVDPHFDTAHFLYFLLTRSDFEARTASQAAEALDAIKDQGFDIFILDTRLPDMNGLELIREIRKLDPNIPLVLHSSAAYEADRKLGFEAGADAYLTKPADLDEIVSTLKGLLDAGTCERAA